MDNIADLLDILAKPERITAIISDELHQVKEQYGDKRRSEIQVNAEDLNLEDLIAPTDVVVTLSHTGYIKSQPLADYRAQKRGGRGKQATATKEDDFIERLFVAHTHDYILCFSSRGRVYWVKVYSVPQGSRISRGKPINNLLAPRGGREDQRGAARSRRSTTVTSCSWPPPTARSRRRRCRSSRGRGRAASSRWSSTRAIT